MKGVRFDKSKARRIARIKIRGERYREFTPYLQVEVYDPMAPGSFGPIMLTLDLVHKENPRQSKPQAFMHLTPAMTIQLIAALVKAYESLFPLVRTVDVLRMVMREAESIGE